MTNPNVNFLVYSPDMNPRENDLWWWLGLNVLPWGEEPTDPPCSPEGLAAMVAAVGASRPDDLVMIGGADLYPEGYNLTSLPGLTVGEAFPFGSLPIYYAERMTFDYKGEKGSGLLCICGEGGAPYTVLTTRAGAEAWGRAYGFGEGFTLE